MHHWKWLDVLIGRVCVELAGECRPDARFEACVYAAERVEELEGRRGQVHHKVVNEPAWWWRRRLCLCLLYTSDAADE